MLLVGLVALVLLAGLVLASALLMLIGSSTAPAQPATTAAAGQPTPPMRTETAVPARTSTVSSTAILLRDAFDRAETSRLGQEENENAAYAVAGGAYVITVKQAQYIAWSPIDGTYNDVCIQVDMMFKGMPGDTAAGMLFNYQDEDNFYFFNVSANGYYALDLRQNGRWISLVDWTPSPDIRRSGSPNRLRVALKGDLMRLYVNGHLLDEVSDTTLASGGIALAVHTFAQDHATVIFDNLLVERN